MKKIISTIIIILFVICCILAIYKTFIYPIIDIYNTKGLSDTIVMLIAELLTIMISIGLLVLTIWAFDNIFKH
jgi:hypothetical protein